MLRLFLIGFGELGKSHWSWTTGMFTSTLFMKGSKKCHLWALLSGLPFPLWNRSLLEGIGNIIGRFEAVEEDFMNTYDKRMARILVEMDITKGLLADVEILCLERLFSQRLDYLGIPFRCSQCREIGHLRHDCPIMRLGSISPRPQ